MSIFSVYTLTFFLHLRNYLSSIGTQIVLNRLKLVLIVHGYGICMYRCKIKCFEAAGFFNWSESLNGYRAPSAI